MTTQELVDVLAAHPTARDRILGIASGDDGLAEFAKFVGLLALWSWRHRIEAVCVIGDKWEAFAVDDGNVRYSGPHPEPWLALLEACERWEG